MVVAGAAILGLVFGSFATVAAHRIPRREGIVRGRSRCPDCGNQIAARDNIPVISFLLLRGRCRQCGARVSPRYPATEVATAALFAGAAAKFGASLEGAVFAAFFWVLVVLTAIDLEHKLLPNRVVYPAFVAGWVGLALAALAAGAPDRLVDAAFGALVFGGFFVVVALVVPAGMGGGDVKLAFVLGTFLGYLGGVGLTLTGMFLSFLTGGIVGVMWMAAAGGNRKMKIPFGPFLAAGTVAGIFGGPGLLRAYLGAL